MAKRNHPLSYAQIGAQIEVNKLASIFDSLNDILGDMIDANPEDPTSYHVALEAIIEKGKRECDRIAGTLALVP